MYVCVCEVCVMTLTTVMYGDKRPLQKVLPYFKVNCKGQLQYTVFNTPVGR